MAIGYWLIAYVKILNFSLFIHHLGNTFHIIWIAIVAFIPMVIWGYVFSYLDNSTLNARRFLAGMVAGGISVIPVLYIEDILRYIGLEKWSVFSFIEWISTTSSWFAALPVFLLLLIVAVLLYVVLWAIFFDRTLRSTGVYVKNFLIFLAIPWVFVVIAMLTGSIGWFTSHLDQTSASFWKYVFSTFQTVLLYYLIVGILEEVSKHFSFLWSSFIDMDSIKKWALLSVFIALWFWFIENILYLSSILSSKGLGSDVVTTWIFRSVFSVFVHIFCGMIVASSFGKSLFLPANIGRIGRYIKVFLVWVLISIVLHAVYDVTLTFGFTMIIFIYLLIGYFYCTKVFYKE